MWNEELKAVREAEVATVLGQIGPLLTDAVTNLDTALSSGSDVGRQSVVEVLLEDLSRITEAGEQVEAAKKSLTIYLAREHHVTRRRLAQHLNVTTTTIHRWLKESEGDH